MSLETWKEEFYPRTAGEVAEEFQRAEKPDYGRSLRPACDLALVEHALKKWRGLTKENLDRHQCMIVFRRVQDEKGSIIDINSMTCSLCQIYLTLPVKESGETECVSAAGTCPLRVVRGANCDESTATEDGPYAAWVRSSQNDPGPMIMLLEDAVRRLQAGEIDSTRGADT